MEKPKVTAEFDISNLDKTIERISQLKSFLQEVDDLISSINNNDTQFTLNFKTKQILNIETLVKIAKDGLPNHMRIVDTRVGSITDDIIRCTCHSILQTLEEHQH